MSFGSHLRALRVPAERLAEGVEAPACTVGRPARGPRSPGRASYIRRWRIR